MNQNTKNWVIARLSERSTWLGIAGFIGLFGLNPDAISGVAEVAIAIASAALVVTGDK